MNKLYYGDNLLFMRDKMKTASVDVIYLDPPFNSNKNYNLLYKKATGVAVPEQELAFCDTWELTPDKEDLIRGLPQQIFRYNEQNREDQIDPEFINFWNLWVLALQHTQPKVLAYLVYMTYRLLEMKRVLKPTGCIYLHCDSTASHYIKVMMDAIFGHINFKNEIIWQRAAGRAKGSQHDSKSWGRDTDTIFYYTKSKKATYHAITLPLTDKEMEEKFPDIDEKGRRYNTEVPIFCSPSMGERPNLCYEYNGIRNPHLSGWRVKREKLQSMDEDGDIIWRGGKTPLRKSYANNYEGKPIGSLWTDIPPVAGDESLGYPTQKPLKLLSRIIKASSNPGDVLDKRYGLENGSDYLTDGVPLSVEGAQELFERDPYQFQTWAVILAGGFSSQKQTGDRGVDGRIHFEVGGIYKNMVISVKGGHLQPAHIRELRGVLEREDSVIAGFICLSTPTHGMIEEAARAGQWEYEGKRYNRIQIRTIQHLLDGIGFDTPTKVQTLNWDRQLHLFS